MMYLSLAIRLLILFFIMSTTSPLFLYAHSSSQIIAATQNGDIEIAFKLYEGYRSDQGESPFLLEKMAEKILSDGIDSNHPEERFFALLSASSASTQFSCKIVDRLQKKKDLPMLMTLLQLSSMFPDKVTERAIAQGIHSPILPLRIAAIEASMMQSPEKALAHIESLNVKLPGELYGRLMPMISSIPSAKKEKLLRQALASPIAPIRQGALIALQMNPSPSFHFTLLSLLSHPDPYTVEGAVGALIAMKNLQIRPNAFYPLIHHSSPHVQLVAAQAILSFNEETGKEIIEKLAQEENPFAISLSNDTHLLEKLTYSPNKSTQVNALIRLIQLKEKRALPKLFAYFLGKESYIAILPTTSPTRALSAWKLKTQPSGEETLLSYKIKDALIEECSIFLSDIEFIHLTKQVLNSRSNRYLATCIQMVQNYHTTRSSDFLREVQQIPGHPHARALATLALFQNEGKEEDRQLLLRYLKGSMIQEKLSLAPSLEMPDTRFYLPADEFSKFYLALFEYLVEVGDQETLPLLSNALIHGHPHNRPILAGLILRALQ